MAGKTRYGGKTRNGGKGKRTVLRAGKSKVAMRRKGSFLTRHMSPRSPGALKTKTGKPTPKALGAKRWGEPVPTTRAAQARLYRKGKRMLAAARR